MSLRYRLFVSLAYLLSALGSLAVMVVRPRDSFALYHACQALGVFLLTLATFAAWLVLGWALAWVPLAGPLLSAVLFGLVAGEAVFALTLSIIGAVRVFRGETRALVLVGAWGERLQAGIART